jgi:hypothetical protein
MMSFRNALLLCGLAPLGIAVAGLATPARAQVLGPDSVAPVVGSAPARNAPQKQPAALPGATSNNAPAPPAPTPADMTPNAALFDAINRGDIAAARDALGRGAELDARNILGMTPLDLAIDLGRNDIAFLLLSMRGGRPAGAPAATTKVAERPVRRPPPPRAVIAPPAPNAPPVHQTAQLFAGDGGSPNPSVGFLGFGSAQRP